MKLLIVDDELWSRQLIKNIINWQDYGFDKVYEAEDGLEGLDILSKVTIDLTITDMRMSGMDGVEFLETIRKRDDTTEVIVMSGYDDFKYIHEALRTKAVDYLLKPIVKAELVQAVTTGIERINERKSYQTIDDILLREDLKKEVNNYYEHKNKIFKAIMTFDEGLLIKQIDEIDERYFSIEQQRLQEYIKIDLGRMIYKLKQDYLVTDKIDDWQNLSFSVIKNQIIATFKKIQESKIDKKIDIFDIQKYIDTHFADAISLSDIANMYFVSKEHLSRLFKKQVGMTVQNYIIERRIDNAKRLLRRHRQISISTISMMSGYLDIQYFYRVFKRLTGLTPQEYKET
jgi:two-component system, response regulator YesN